MGYRLDGRGIGVRFSAEARHFYLLYSVQTDTGSLLGPYVMGILGSFSTNKEAGAWN
jgi:hypothetical protein